jgi:hypothetical protein
MGFIYVKREHLCGDFSGTAAAIFIDIFYHNLSFLRPQLDICFFLRHDAPVMIALRQPGWGYFE